jgi:uncharacterized protein (DUF362 family)
MKNFVRKFEQILKIYVVAHKNHYIELVTMQRREFIRISGGMLLTLPVTGRTGVPADGKSRVVISRYQPGGNKLTGVGAEDINGLFQKGLLTLFGVSTTNEAWRQIIRRDQTVGLKVNCLSGRGTTHAALVEAVIESLRRYGIPAERIVIWDRFNRDLESAGFTLNFDSTGVRCFGNDHLGFDDDFQISGAAASLVCKTLTRICDVVINLPVLKDHGIAGMTGCMKNFFGAIHNPNKYHLDTGNPYIADVYNFPVIRSKVVLHISDAINAQYEGGPSYMPHWSWPYNGLLFSRDPVALDYTGWQIIEAERQRRGFKSLKDAGREPVYILTAADAAHRLGNAAPEKIQPIDI